MIKITCPMCMERGKDWEGSDPNCAFDENGTFKKDNWNCATMNELRYIAEKNNTSFRYWDESIGHVVIMDEYGEPEDFIVMTWYKNRGKTSNAVVMFDDSEVRPLTLQDATQAINGYRDILAD